MKEIIRDVVEIDKDMREVIKRIQEEKEKIPNFLHTEKERISLEERRKVDNLIENRKQEIKLDLENRIKQATKEYNDSKVHISKTFDKYREEWIEEIYKYCVSD